MKSVVITKGLAPYRLDFYEVLNASKDISCEVIVPKTIADDHPWQHLLDGRQLKVISLDVDRPPNIGILQSVCDKVVQVFMLFRTLEKSQPDVVIGHECSPFVLTGLLWTKIRGRIYVISSEIGKESPKQAISNHLKCVHGFVELFVDGKIANSPDARIRHTNSDLPLVFCPHAISGSFFNKEHSKKEVIQFVHVSSLCERKGIDILLLAIERVRSNFSANCFQFVIAGTGELKKYHDLAQRLNISNVVQFVGFVEGEDLRSLYIQSDVFVLASNYDTYAVVTYEAALHSLPLIVSDAAGSSKVMIDEGVNGFCFQSGSVEDLAEKISFFLRNTQKAQEMGKASEMKCEEFGVSNSVTKAVKMFKDLCSFRG